jgi:hypothetical protein
MLRFGLSMIRMGRSGKVAEKAAITSLVLSVDIPSAMMTSNSECGKDW